MSMNFWYGGNVCPTTVIPSTSQDRWYQGERLRYLQADEPIDFPAAKTVSAGIKTKRSFGGNPAVKVISATIPTR